MPFIEKKTGLDFITVVQRLPDIAHKNSENESRRGERRVHPKKCFNLF
jgi:hypothetical protein